MKIIFLDFDGVLNSNNWYSRRFNEIGTSNISGKYPLYEFDPLSIKELNRIIEQTGASVVVSSSWRVGNRIEDLQQMLDAVGFVGKVIDTTPRFRTKGTDNNQNAITYTIPRGCEIDWWLRETGKFKRINWSCELQIEYLDKAMVKNYVILDDDSDMLYGQREHYVKTDGYDSGLNKQTADIAIQILNTPITKLYNL